MSKKIQANVFRRSYREFWYIQSYTPEYRRDIRILMVVSRFLKALFLRLNYDLVGLSVGLSGCCLRVAVYVGVDVLPDRMRWRLNRMGAAFGGAVTYLGVMPAFHQRFMRVGWSSVISGKVSHQQLAGLVDIYGDSSCRYFGNRWRANLVQNKSTSLLKFMRQPVRTQRKHSQILPMLNQFGGLLQLRKYLKYNYLFDFIRRSVLYRRFGWERYSNSMEAMFLVFTRNTVGTLSSFVPEVNYEEFGSYGLAFLFSRRFSVWLSSVCSNYTGYRTCCDLQFIGSLDIKYRKYAIYCVRSVTGMSNFLTRRLRGSFLLEDWDYILCLLRASCFFFNGVLLLSFLVSYFDLVAKNWHYMYLQRMVLLFKQLVVEFFLIKSVSFLVSGRIGGSRRKRTFRSGGVDRFSSPRVARSEVTGSVVYASRVSNTELGAFYFRLWVEYGGRFFAQSRFRRLFRSRYNVDMSYNLQAGGLGSCCWEQRDFAKTSRGVVLPFVCLSPQFIIGRNSMVVVVDGSYSDLYGRYLYAHTAFLFAALLFGRHISTSFPF